MTLISVVVPCRNEQRHIEVCLASLLSQDLGGATLEILVADGRSTDGTRELLEQLASRDPRIRVIDNPGQIVSTGLNRAIAAARGEVVIRADSHTEYASDYLRQCLRVLDETGADNVGGPWVARGQGYISEAIAAAFQSEFGAGGARSHNMSYEGLVDTVYLGCWRRDAFDRFGLFDEHLVRNQDDELNLRIIRGGGRIWQSPAIRSWYTPRNSLRALFHQYLQYGYWKVAVIRKHRQPAALRHLVPAGVVTIGALLLLAAPMSAPVANVLGALVLAYIVLAAVATVRSTDRKRLWLILPLVFTIFHVSYGLGFLRGLLDFRRGAARETMSVLTRT